VAFNFSEASDVKQNILVFKRLQTENKKRRLRFKLKEKQVQIEQKLEEERKKLALEEERARIIKEAAIRSE
jgi:KaiC/GvpD/RAD55 family RecA-like ATPase